MNPTAGGRGFPRVIGGMTPRPSPRVLEALVKYASYNAGDPQAYPEVREALDNLVDSMRRLMLPGGGVAGGLFTSGASEGNLLALLYYRQRGAKRVVYFDSAHYSVEKAARILGMPTLRLPTEDGVFPRVDLLERFLEKRDVLVLTLGTTETGFVDPVSLLEPLASVRGAWIHVDAAYAGPLIQYWSPHKAPRRLSETTMTAVVDLHKIPEAPIGSGLLLAHSPDVIETLSWPAPYLPSGRQAGILGTRPGGNVMASRVALEEMIRKGPRRLAEELLKGARWMAGELQDCCGYRVTHPIETPVVCLEHPRVKRVLANLDSLGFKAYSCRGARGIRLALLPHTLEILGHIRETLARAAGGHKPPYIH